MAAAELWIVAGPNGAGKTTLVQAHPISGLLPHVRFVNPDDRAREMLWKQGWAGFSDAPPAVQREVFRAAAQAVAEDLDAALTRGEPVGVETVLSTDKYRPLVERTRAGGGFVGLIYVGLVSPELACERVTRRVRQGGHDVPAEKVAARWHRSLANLSWFALHASAFWVFDNSDTDPERAPMLVATGNAGGLKLLAGEAPACFREALAVLIP